MANPIKVINGILDVERELADFIQGGPSGGLPGHVRDKFRHRCDEFANLPDWATALTGVAGGSIGRFCEPYWNDRGFDGPEANPPILPGGQCVEPYEVYTTTRNPDGTSNPEAFTGVFSGPFSFDAGTAPPFPCDPGFTRIGEQFLRDGGGVIIVAGGNGCFASPPFATFRFVRVDGEPDDCGNQEPDFPIRRGPNPPPNPGPLPGPEPTDNPDPENPIPIFPIPPFDDPVYGPQPITGPDQTGPGGGGEPGQPVGGDGLPGDPGAIGGTAGEVIGGEPGQEVDFGPPADGRVWVGCIVDLTADSRVGNIPGTGPQSTVWPSVRGNVALKYSSFFGSSYRINSRYTEVFRPNTSLIVTGCFLQVQPGGSALVFPISALKCPSNPCGE